MGRETIWCFNENWFEDYSTKKKSSSVPIVTKKTVLVAALALCKMEQVVTYKTA